MLSRSSRAKQLAHREKSEEVELPGPALPTEQGTILLTYCESISRMILTHSPLTSFLCCSFVLDVELLAIAIIALPAGHVPRLQQEGVANSLCGETRSCT